MPGEKPGEVNEYIYTREGTHGGDAASVTTFQVVYYDTDGIPSGGGETLANLIDGKWVFEK